MNDNEVDAEAFIAHVDAKIRPLIDDLARQIGESTEAWRGIDMLLSGLGFISESTLDFGLTPREQLIVLASIMACISNHPALEAARQHFAT